MTPQTVEELMGALEVLRRLRSEADARGDQEGFNALVLAHRVVLFAAAEQEREAAYEAKSTDR